MSTIVLRQTKGSALTFAEGDANFSNLNTDKLEDITGESIGDLSDVDITSNTDGYVLTYNSGSGNLELQAAAAGVDSLSALTDVTLNAPPTDGYVLQYNSGTSQWQDAAITQATGNELENIVEDTTPQLGGTLDGQDNVVSAVEFKDYKETVNALGSTDTPSINAVNGNVQSVTITSGLTIPDISNFDTGASITLIVSGDGSASDGTTGTICRFANAGTVTLTGTSIISIFNDGTNYLVSIATDFASA